MSKEAVWGVSLALQGLCGGAERPAGGQQQIPAWMQVLLCDGLTHPFERAGNREAPT